MNPFSRLECIEFSIDRISGMEGLCEVSKTWRPLLGDEDLGSEDHEVSVDLWRTCLELQEVRFAKALRDTSALCFARCNSGSIQNQVS